MIFLEGSGKTTLLNVAGGYSKAMRGTVTLNGQDIKSMLRSGVSYVMQNEVFFPNLTLRETITVSWFLCALCITAFVD